MEGLSSAATLPVDLADLLLVRLDRLDEPSRRVVGAASVAGRRVSHDLLARVLAASGSDARDLDLGLRQAVDALILEPRQAGSQPGYAFRHALLSEAVYDDLLPGERARLHTAYVTALQDGSIPGTSAELALHARAANDIETAIAASTEAGDEAMRVGAPEEAAQHYQSALEMLGPRAAVEVGLVASAADALVDAGDAYRAVKLVVRPPDDAARHRAGRVARPAAPGQGRVGVHHRGRLRPSRPHDLGVGADPGGATVQAPGSGPDDPRPVAALAPQHGGCGRGGLRGGADGHRAGLPRAGPGRLAGPRQGGRPLRPAGRRHRAAPEGSRRGRRTSTSRSGPCTSWPPCTSASGSSPTLDVSTSRPWRGPRRVGGPGPRGGSTPGLSPDSPPTSSATGTTCSPSPTPRVRPRRLWRRPTCAPWPSTWSPDAGWRRFSTTSPPSARSGSGTAPWCSTARPRRSTPMATVATSRRPVTSTTTPSPRSTGSGRAASCGSGCG